MLGSNVDLIRKDDHEEGEISGISAANIPAWFRPYYKPGTEIASMANWDEKVQRIAEEALNWDIGSFKRYSVLDRDDAEGRHCAQ